MSRFVDISEEEIVHLEQSKDSLNTKRAIKRSVNIFREFLGPENAQFEELPKYILDNKLRNFYASLRTIKGDEVKKSTLNTIKYGLGKYLKDTCKIDIQTDAAFESSRKTFKAKMTDLQKKGKGAIQHKTEISTEDLERLMQPDNLAFNCNTPVGLQNKVWFDIMYHLCRRGQENLRDMKKSTFTVKTDACGREYVSQAIDEADKNHGCDTGPDDTVGEGRMYAQPGSVMCPVKSFKDYLAKLSPDLNELWQRPRDSFNPNDTIWFCKCPLGKKLSSKNDVNNINYGWSFNQIY